jgi:hypothetical protein
LRRIKLKKRSEFSGPDDLALKVHQEQLRRVRVGQKARIDPEPQLWDPLGQCPRAGRVAARLFLEPLDPLDESGFTRTLANPGQRLSALLLQPTC